MEESKQTEEAAPYISYSGKTSGHGGQKDKNVRKEWQGSIGPVSGTKMPWKRRKYGIFTERDYVLCGSKSRNGCSGLNKKTSYSV